MGPATQELVHVLKAALKTVLKDCLCNDRWMESSLRQGGDLKEIFAEILYDLQWYYVMEHYAASSWSGYFETVGLSPNGFFNW